MGRKKSLMLSKRFEIVLSILGDYKRENIVFLHAVIQMSFERNNGLKQDVPTKWNSIYLMFESAIHYRHAFAYLEMTNQN